MQPQSPIIQTIITEKSSLAQSKGRYTFLVKREANKVEIKKAIETSYGAPVKRVQTSIVPNKYRLLKGRYNWAKRPAYKKAIVTLKGKATIDPNKVGEAKAKKEPKKSLKAAVGKK